MLTECLLEIFRVCFLNLCFWILVSHAPDESTDFIDKHMSKLAFIPQGRDRHY